MAYDRLDPIGGPRIDHAAAVIAMTVANALSKKKRGGTFTVDDFMPTWSAPKRKQSREEQIAIAAAITQQLGGKDLRKNKA